MKTIGRVLFTLAIIIIFSSCFSPWDGDTGTFSISIGGSGSGRFVLPEGVEIENLEHVITLEGPGPKQTISVTGAQTVQFSVVPGVWDITIEAYYEKDLVAVGSKTVDIKPGPNGAITIPMGPPKSTLMEMVLVEGGSFQMGTSSGGENDGRESPAHTVTLTGFYIGKYEVTQAQYEAVMGNNPSSNKTDADEGEVQENRPVEYVTWDDAIEFCNTLSSLEGLTPVYTITGATVTADWSKNGYRLPTEAEWEYAAKGGQKSKGYIYSGSNDLDDVAWYYSNSGNKTHEVGKLAPNELGIYDMSGNVWERCWDWYDANYYNSSPPTDPRGPSSGPGRVQRGGGYNDDISDGYFRSAYRKPYTDRWINYGFRVVRPAQPSVEPGTGELHFELIADGTAYRVSRGTATGNIVIPAFYSPDSASPLLPVTTIGKEINDYDSTAFGGTERPNTYNTTVTSITFAEGSQLTTISSHAFYRCSNLASIDIPDSVTEIGPCAFEKTSLTSITIPPRVKVISDGTFYDCIRLESITIPASITKIDNNAFQGCTGLTSVTFLIEEIEFYDTSFPGGMNLVLAYYKDYNPNGGAGTYTREANSDVWTKQTTGTPGLMYYEIDGENAYGVRAENKEISGAVIIPAAYNDKSVTEIGDDAFSGCTGLTSINIPASVTYIGGAAFLNCTNLAGISIPEGVTVINVETFINCTSLTNITIPEGVTEIGNAAFYGCTGLISVTFKGEIASSLFGTSNAFPGDLRDKFYATDSTNGTPGTYTRPDGTSTMWTRSGEPSENTYTLGGIGPGGGIIFYVSTDGFTVQMVDSAQNYTAHYLEAAPADMETRLKWASEDYADHNIEGTENEIGTGRKNTALILADDANAPAALACNTLNEGGKTDWFLPSKDELNELYVRRTLVENLDTSSESTAYWSSSQYTFTYQSGGVTYTAMTQDFDDGDVTDVIKYAETNNFWVRAIRAF